MFENKVAGAYRLSVDQKGIRIIGADAQGLFYGLQSLKQMLPAAIFQQNYAAHREAFSDLRIGFVEIEDAPRFKWRGFMLDSCRHIQTIDKIKQYIDLMALYKMNVFHWHLTDDEAWRAEIKKYPKLTSIGGYPGDRSKDEELNGYYTQEQMREIVAYAHERYIKVVPEFDIPGHVNALKRGIRSIGWAEHIQGGVPEGQIVQAWNKPSEALQGVRAGREVINSYNRKIYLDYPANNANAEELNKHNRRYRSRLVSAKSIYAFEPVPGSLTPEERARVIGVEAPVWTEDIRMDRLDSKIFPRLISVAEGCLVR